MIERESNRERETREINYVNIKENERKHETTDEQGKRKKTSEIRRGKDGG